MRTTQFATTMNWGDTILAVTALQNAGPNPTRKSFLEAVGNLKNFDAGGIVPPFNPLDKVQQPCVLIMHFHAGKWRRADPPQQGYDCGQIIS